MENLDPLCGSYQAIKITSRTCELSPFVKFSMPDGWNTELLNGFHRYLLTGEGNLCAKDGQNLLGINQNFKEDSV